MIKNDIREIKDPISFLTILRALETVVIFALLGLVIYAVVFGVKTTEIRDHYRISGENEQQMLEILQKLETTQNDVKEIKEEVKPE